MTNMTSVQKLYEMCKASFSEALPSAEAVERVRAVLDDIKCSDVGLEDEKNLSERGIVVPNGRKNKNAAFTRLAPPISYLHLFECDKFSMGIFCLPQSAVIPLHNHPGMTVLSKLLYGSMHVKSYDWVNPTDEKLNADPSVPRSAKLVKDHVMVAPCEPFLLYPTSGGNIHAFTAVSSCAVLDVLAPPYSSTAGRHCIYYQQQQRQQSTASSGMLFSNDDVDDDVDGNAVAYLQEFQPPNDFVVHRGIYRGPKVHP